MNKRDGHKILNDFTSLRSFPKCLRDPKLLVTYADFFKTFGMFLIPLVILASIWAPGLMWQLLTVIPFWAYLLAKAKSPLKNDMLFIEQLQTLDPSVADEMKKKVSKNLKQELDWPEWSNHLFQGFRTWWHFSWKSIAFLLLSVTNHIFYHFNLQKAFPVIGSFFSFLGQSYLVSESLGWNILSVYTRDYRDMDYQQQKDWMERHKFVALGFVFPFTLISSIPFIGPLFILLAQAASAHLFYEFYKQESGTNKVKKAD